jgi:hypothetical protein
MSGDEHVLATGKIERGHKWSDLLPWLFVLILIFIGLGIVTIEDGPAEHECAARSLKACVSTLTGDGGGSASHFEELTPQGAPSDGGSSSTGKEEHEAAVAGLAAGSGSAGVGNPLNPVAVQRRQTPSHTDTGSGGAPQEPTVIVVPEPQQNPCDPNHDPSCGGTPEPPPCDQHNGCGGSQDPPPYHHNDECDPDSYYYDPSAICL